MLVVRVKRKRDELPPESLFVVDTPYDGILQKKPKKSEADDENSEVPKQLLLKRVSTLKSNTSGKHLDNETSQILKKRAEESTAIEELQTEEVITGSNSRKRKLIVAPERKRLLVEGIGETCIVVDMLQVLGKPEQNVPMSSTENNKTSNRILDPATRELEKGITAAVTKGDFNDISAAIIKGANASYQIPIESKGLAAGYTSIMAAAMWSNIRMVKRLVGLTVDVTLRNRDGVTAFELVGLKKPKSEDNNEIKALIQTLLIKQVQIKKPMKYNEEFMMNDSAMQGEDFVVDVYTTSGALPSVPLDSDLNSADYVHIDGLKIMDDGQVELVAYDSDWSDLAEDEDPDSNDERYYANDYPEESEEEAWFQENHQEDGDYCLDELEEEYLAKEGLRFAQPESIHPKMKTLKNLQPASVDDEIEELNVDGQALFGEGSRIGKVLHPHILGDQEEHDRMDTVELQKLWGEETPHDQMSNPHIERIDHMRERTNMVFASNPKEFDQRGLPKYARDLSDDDNEEYLYGNTRKDEYNSYAYDSTYDHDDDDDN